MGLMIRDIGALRSDDWERNMSTAGLNPGLRGDKPETDPLTYGIMYICY
jgi:hypothetical protein